MPTLRIIPATSDLVPFLVDRMAAKDCDALCEANGREQTIAHLEGALRQSARSWCAMDSGGVVFLVAAVRVQDGGAILWGLHTSAVRRHLRESLRCFRAILAEALEAFDWVGMDVPPFQALVMRARRAGFAVGAPVDMGGTLVCPCICRQASMEGVVDG